MFIFVGLDAEGILFYTQFGLDKCGYYHHSYYHNCNTCYYNENSISFKHEQNICSNLVCARV